MNLFPLYIFNTWDSFLFHPSYSVGYGCLCSSCSFTQIFHIQNFLSSCFLYCLYFSLHVLNCFLHLLDCFFLVFLNFFDLLISSIGFFYLLISSNFLFVFFSITLRECFISSLKVSIVLIKLCLKSFSSASSGLRWSSLPVMWPLGSGGTILFLDCWMNSCIGT